MNRSRILKVKFIVFLFLVFQVATCDDHRDNETRPSDQSDKSSSNYAVPHPPQKQNALEKNIQNSNSNNLTSKTSGKKPANVTSEKVDTTENGGSSLKRGFYVLIGLSVLVIAYFVFRSFRVTKTRAQMIRKYGILAHRQDVEMRPLPLDEDDEDDTTVFDVSNMSTPNTVQTRP